ncbi:MAG TPA: hypothetical protein VEF71_21775, partial [Streptosporangiaceae bacterium]|nr:hypothetical protein [Streptosporangiaceae bacterium]
MPIVGGLDICRKQITFDYLDTGAGQVRRGQIAPADRAHLRTCARGWPGSPGATMSRSRWRGAPGGGTWPGSWPEPGSPRIWPSRPTPRHGAARRGRKRHAKTGKTDARHLRLLLAEGRLPECWIPPAHVLECRALLELYNDLRRERTAWAQRIHAVLFHQGAPQLGEGTLRTEKGVAGLRDAAAAHLSPAGQLQVATALEMIDALEARLHAVRHQLLDAARHLAGAKALAARLYGVGPVTALAITCWLGGAGRFSSARKAVRFA